MLDTKAMIVHQILKLNRPFRPREIHEEIGISGQNLNNHLKRLVAKGLLLKHGQIYEVSDRAALIDDLAETKESAGLVKPRDVLGEPISIKDLAEAVDSIARARILGIEGASNAHVKMNNLVNDLEQQVKHLRRWLNNKRYSEARAEADFDLDYFKKIEEILDNYE